MTTEASPGQRTERATRSFLSRFLQDKKGSTAIEFVALAIPFCLLVFAILESCISFAAQQVMANATDDIARQLRTGQIRAATLTKETLHDMICGQLEIMVSDGCPGLEVDLRKFDSFADAAKVRIKITDGKIDTTGFDVKPGGAMTRNMLRVFYPWPVMTDLMRKSMSNLNNGKTLHFATATWQNEPFDD